MTEIIVALITGTAAVIGSYIANNRGNKKTAETIANQLNVSQAVTDTKLEELTREVRMHNDFATRIPVIQEQIKEIKSNIGELKEYHK